MATKGVSLVFSVNKSLPTELMRTCSCAGPGCRKDDIIAVSPRLINTLYDFLHSEKPGFIHKGDTDQLLLLSHSLGGSVGFEALAGESTLATCSGTAALLVHMTMRLAGTGVCSRAQPSMHQERS